MASNDIKNRRCLRSIVDMSPDEFRTLGYELIDQIARFYGSLDQRELTRAAPADEIRRLLGTEELPEEGTEAAKLLADVVPLLFDHSLHNGHPRFLGYITSSAAPLGALADLLAASVNANLAIWDLSPVASEIESQTVRWIADFIGYERDCTGLMVSGGNMANFLAFVAARTAKAGWELREEGNYGDERRLTAYVSDEAHTWVQKAADVCGIGAQGIRWIDTDDDGRMRLDRLRGQLTADRKSGRLPFLVIATAGSVSTGVIDPIRNLAGICANEDLWLHVDGAYGAPAAALPESPDDLRALSLADSVATDPHKWLYCPIEAACILTRHKTALQDAFAFYPSFYLFDAEREHGVNYYQLGMQNSRGFRALKVWLTLRHAGRKGYCESIRGDIQLAEYLYELANAHPELSAHSVNLSIATMRYVPADIDDDGSARTENYLNKLNQALLADVQAGGRFYLSNAIINGRYLLRACVVNFRTSREDIDAIPEMIVDIGRRLDKAMRPGEMSNQSSRPTVT